jgi:hypothetical protein
MIAPRAVYFNESPRDAFFAEAERVDQRVAAAIVSNDVRADTMKPARFESVIEHRTERVAHEAVTDGIVRKPIANMTLKTWPIGYSAERTRAEHAISIARADEQTHLTEAFGIGPKHAREAIAESWFVAARGSWHPRKEVIVRTREHVDELRAIAFSGEAKHGGCTDAHNSLRAFACGGFRRERWNDFGFLARHSESVRCDHDACHNHDHDEVDDAGVREHGVA